MPEEQTERWLSIDEAAAELGVTRRAVRRDVSDGKLRAFKMPVGGRTMIRVEDLEAFRQPRPKADTAA